MRTSTPVPGRPNVAALAVLGCLAAGSGAGLTVTLVSCTPQQLVEAARPLSAGEAHRLAEMRLVNHRDGRAGLAAVAGVTGAQIWVTGWVDWRRQLVYASVDGPAAGRDRGLVQATPRFLAVRPADALSPSAKPTAGPAAKPTGGPSAEPSPGPSAGADPATDSGDGVRPPGRPPGGGWRIRSLADPGSSRSAPLDSLLALVLATAADRPDPADTLRKAGSRWLGRDRMGEATVDVLLGPAVATATTTAATTANPATATKPTATANPTANPTATNPAAAASRSESVRYWLDADARLHRLEAMLPNQVPVQVNFDRTARTEPAAIAAFGGAPVQPRPVTGVEARLLARLRPAGHPPGGGFGTGAKIALALPTRSTDQGAGRSTGRREIRPARVENLRGAGWITWSDPGAYLALRDIDGTPAPLLVRADHGGLAIRSAPRPPGADAPESDGHGAADAAAGVQDTGPANVSHAGDAAGTEDGIDGPSVALSSGPRVAIPPLPPLPPPVDRPWSYRSWQRPGDPIGAPDLDLLITEIFAIGAAADDPTRRPPAADRLRGTASWLRPDTIGRQRVGVFEIRRPEETDVPAGQGRLRYWVDGSGALHRLELLTHAGVFAQLDLLPTQVPYLPRVPTA